MPPEINTDKSIDDILNDFESKFHAIRKTHSNLTDSLRLNMAEAKINLKKILNDANHVVMQEQHCALINQFASMCKKYNEACLKGQLALQSLLSEYEFEDRARIVHIVNPYKYLRPARSGSLTNILLEILY
jgi:transcription-repair coupling factor (superfamily II helicase)